MIKSLEEWKEILLDIITTPGNSNETPGWFWATLTREIRNSGLDLKMSADLAERLVREYYPDFKRV